METADFLPKVWTRTALAQRAPPGRDCIQHTPARTRWELQCAIQMNMNFDGVVDSHMSPCSMLRLEDRVLALDPYHKQVRYLRIFRAPR